MRLPRCLATVAAALALTAPAEAQEPGVFVDPDSPTAKEYALPLESVRRQADPRTPSDAAVPQGQRVSPAFGEGIGPAASQGGTAAGASAEAGSDGTRGGGARDGGDASDEGAASGTGGAADDSAAATVRAATANPGAPGGDVSDTLTIGGGALAVLLLGAGAGLLLRRRRA
jgi:hypothetical protein